MSTARPVGRVTVSPAHPAYVCGDERYFYVGVYAVPGSVETAAGVATSHGWVEYSLLCGAQLGIDPASPAGRQHLNIAAAIMNFNATQDMMDPDAEFAGVHGHDSGNASCSSDEDGDGDGDGDGDADGFEEAGYGSHARTLLPTVLPVETLSYRVAGLLRDVESRESIGCAGGRRDDGGVGSSSSVSHRRKVYAPVPSPVSYSLGGLPAWGSPKAVALVAGSPEVPARGALTGPPVRPGPGTGSSSPMSLPPAGGGRRRRRRRKGGRVVVPPQARDLVRSLVQLSQPVPLSLPRLV